MPHPARLRIALAEKGATDKVQFVPVDVMGGEHRSEAFRAKNSDAVAPCLELEDGTHMTQCNAITAYIDGPFDGPSLTGTTAQDLARISVMNLRAENSLVNAVGAYFHHASPGLSPDLETDQCAQWGTKQKTVAARTMAYLDGVLAESDYLAGDTFSVADITALAGLAFADFAKVEISATLTHLHTLRARVAARPTIAA